MSVQEALPGFDMARAFAIHSERCRMAVHFSSESVEWYTPPSIVTRVVTVLGTIDLDPCSNSHVHPAVPAVRHYTIEDDGLRQPWHGNVYMNPPYGAEIAAWTSKLTTEYRACRVSEAIALLPARTETRWFQQIPATLTCFIKGRLKFSNAENSAPFPSAVLYLGSRSEAFAAAFSDVGPIYRIEDVA